MQNLQTKTKWNMSLYCDWKISNKFGRTFILYRMLLELHNYSWSAQRNRFASRAVYCFQILSHSSKRISDCAHLKVNIHWSPIQYIEGHTIVEKHLACVDYQNFWSHEYYMQPNLKQWLGWQYLETRKERIVRKKMYNETSLMSSTNRTGINAVQHSGHRRLSQYGTIAACDYWSLTNAAKS